MRNVIFAINITLDGCCDHTKRVPDEAMRRTQDYLKSTVDVAQLLTLPATTVQ
jgi:hypothetical protein